MLSAEERTMSRELVVQCPDGQKKSIPLTGARLSIGRSSAAELCFPEDAGLMQEEHLGLEVLGIDAATDLAQHRIVGALQADLQGTADGREEPGQFRVDEF